MSLCHGQKGHAFFNHYERITLFPRYLTVINMKYTTIIPFLCLGFATFISTGCIVDPGYATTTASSSSYDGDDTGHDFRRKVRHLREHYARVRDEAENHGAGQHIRGELAEISQGIDRVASFVYSGQFSPDRAQENISRLHGELRGVWQEIHQ
jgi:hypothetical protein